MSLNRAIKYFVSIVALAVSVEAYSQDTTIYIYPNQDTYTDSYNDTTNYSTDTSFFVGTKHSGGGYQRAYLGFDLSVIPAGADIAQVKIKLTRISPNDLSNTFKTYVVTEDWDADTLTHNGQPDFSTAAYHYTNGMTMSGSVGTIWNRQMFTEINWGLVDYYGMSIQVSDETDTTLTGMEFYSSNASNSTKRPYLEVNYYMPHEVANVNITHESDVALSDGIIDLDILYGSQDFHWEWINSTGTVISTDTILDSIGYGWYGLHIQGNKFNGGGENFYYGFLVGTECQSVDISYRSDANFNNSAMTLDRVANGIDYRNTNYEFSSNFMCNEWGYTGGWGRYHTYDRAKIWMDDAFTVTKADYTLTGSAHYGTIYKTNETEFLTITEDWDRFRITYNTQPATSDTVNPQIDSLSYPTQNRTIDMIDSWNYWKSDNTKNYGVKFKLQTEDEVFSTRVIFYSANHGVESRRPLYEFTLDLTPTTYVTAAWNEDTGSGSIDIDLAPLCIANTPPYFYFISNDTIVDLDTLYSFYTDTLIGLDSTTFYAMSTTDLQKSYNDLEAGQYYVTVFDKFGVRVVDEAFFMMGPLTFEAQTGLTSSGSEVTASIANSVGSFDCYTYDDHNSSMKIELTGVSGIQSFGFVDMTRTMATYADIEYGFYLSGSDLYTVTAGTLSGTFITASASTVLDVVNEDGNLKLMVDGVEHATKSAPSAFAYKIGIEGQSGNKIGFYPANFLWPKIHPYKFKSVMNHFTCQGDLGSFSFSFGKTGYFGQCPISYTVTGPSGPPSPLQTLNTTNQSIVINALNGNSLTAGTYIIAGEISACGGLVVPFYEKVYLGYDVEWDVNNIVDYTTPTSNSVLRTLPLNSTLSTAIAENVDNSGIGWIEFTPSTRPVYQIFPTSTIRFQFDNFASQYPSFTEGYMSFKEMPNTSDDVWFIVDFGQSQTAIGWMKKNDRVMVFYSAGEIKITINGIAIPTSPYSANPLTSVVGVKCQSRNSSYGFEDVVTSFSCPNILSYAKLERKITGVKYRTENKVVRFYYDEEYEAQGTDLVYKVYPDDDRISPALTGLQEIELVEYGDNRYDLNCTTISSGSYILEVENDKNELFYLRFILE